MGGRSGRDRSASVTSPSSSWAIARPVGVVEVDRAAPASGSVRASVRVVSSSDGRGVGEHEGRSGRRGSPGRAAGSAAPALSTASERRRPAPATRGSASADQPLGPDAQRDQAVASRLDARVQLGVGQARVAADRRRRRPGCGPPAPRTAPARSRGGHAAARCRSSRTSMRSRSSAVSSVEPLTGGPGRRRPRPAAATSRRRAPATVRGRTGRCCTPARRRSPPARRRRLPLGQVKRQVELGRPARRVGSPATRRPGQRQRAGRVVLEREHHLEQRVVRPRRAPG